MVFDSPQQKEALFGILQMVQINAPVNVARQQIIQVDDILQAVATGEIKAPQTSAELTKEAK